MTVRLMLEIDATPEGLAVARSELDRFAAEIWGRREPSSRESPPDHDPGGMSAEDAQSPAVTVYRNSEFRGHSRELLKVLAESDEALTPAEIGERMPPFEDGSALEPKNVRAVLRNIKRNEAKRRREGEMADDSEVVRADWSRYDREGSGRYFLSKDDRDAILRWISEHE